MEQVRLNGLLDAVAGKRVLVVGDCMLDEYLWGSASRVSPEAPVMVVEQQEMTYAAGGASNAAANVVALGGQAAMVAVIGDDLMGARLRQELERAGVEHEGLAVHPDRPTTVKTRIMAHNQQVLRVDREVRLPIAAEVAARLVAQIRSEARRADAVLISDYSKGVLTEQVVGEAVRAAREAGIPVLANPKPVSVHYYRGASLVSLNQSEAEAATGLPLGDSVCLEQAGERLLGRCEVEACIITLGGRGLALFESGKAWRHLPVVPLEVYDPCGCGDSAIAAGTLARAAGADWVEAAALANLAGNAKVRKRGVVPVSRKEIEGVWALRGTGNGNRRPAELY